jgi:hypothetical protein
VRKGEMSEGVGRGADKARSGESDASTGGSLIPRVERNAESGEKKQTNKKDRGTQQCAPPGRNA